MDLGLHGRVALVSGGSAGIGAAVAARLADEGTTVVVAARDRRRLAATAAELGPSVHPRTADMADPDQCAAVVDWTLRTHGRIDAAVACTGAAPAGRLSDVDEEDWLLALRSKLLAHATLCRAVLPALATHGGAAVLVGGNAGLQAAPWEVLAGSVNAAVLSLARSLAAEYGTRGVRINTVHPGPVDTGRWGLLTARVATLRGVSEQQVERDTLGSLPPGRLCTADEVASVVAFLVSPRAAFVNGAHLAVDGAQQKGRWGL
ncbi:short-chain dehydrogenase [Prauserella sp. PE36]|uniref:SDR family oxidoreductase n=1 Tax=Prauserella sp. PE36 TaxID=1504709 RepID=UPI000DE44BBE|nr:SDR family oxidoreductase [Prauserella sp. PE36]RBM18330.1 short-chain dehydrogenase [Prauserella sp. PE36]